MKVVDANVLVYSVDARSPFHGSARRWLDAGLRGGETIGFAWVVLLAFLRVVTHPGITRDPLSVERAARVVEKWLAQPPAVVVHPTPRHASILRSLLSATGTGSNLVNDAHLAALALEHGGEVVSFDTGFARFDGVSWSAPSSS
jgi:toxin-antitoxin system PIN domain toxin